jgi:hypothetical protein
MRGEDGNLPLNGAHHVRMRVPDVRNVVVHVEVGASRGIVQPHALAAHQVQRLVVKQLGPGPHEAVTAPQIHGRRARLQGARRLVPFLGEGFAIQGQQMRQ